MPEIKSDLSESEAEEILIGLSYRYKQGRSI